MKPDGDIPAGAPATLQDVLDRLNGAPGLFETRKRDLRSAITTFTKVRGEPPAAIPLKLADIRRTLDGIVPREAQISHKRWANLRSDLAAAIEVSGLRPMLKTRDVALNKIWSRLFEQVTDQRVRKGLSRFARWASLRRVDPQAVDTAVIARFVAELDEATLVRNFASQHSIERACALRTRLHRWRSNRRDRAYYRGKTFDVPRSGGRDTLNADGTVTGQ
jgi:hypothetical protein